MWDAKRKKNLGVRIMLGVIVFQVPAAWLADARVDDIDRALLPLLRRAGCSTLCLGVESGSQRVLDALRKGITVEQTRAAAAPDPTPAGRPRPRDSSCGHHDGQARA